MSNTNDNLGGVPSAALLDSLSGEWNATELARRIHCVLSNKDSLRIFALAASGIMATTDEIEKSSLTKKRYYVRLKQLIDLGLVAKKTNGQKIGGKRQFYEQTLFGRIVYREHVLKLEGSARMFLTPHAREGESIESKFDSLPEHLPPMDVKS